MNPKSSVRPRRALEVERHPWPCGLGDLDLDADVQPGRGARVRARARGRQRAVDQCGCFVNHAGSSLPVRPPRRSSPLMPPAPAPREAAPRAPHAICLATASCAGPCRRSFLCGRCAAAPFTYWRWKTKLTSGAHLARRGAAGPSCRRGRREKLSGVGRTFRVPLLDCAPACHASVACHVGKSGKYEGAARREW